MVDNFKALHDLLRLQVDLGFLPSVSSTLFRGSEVVDKFCYGYADLERQIDIGFDSIFRMFSSTKIVTACAALMLFDQGCFQLDDPIETYLPELGSRQVLREDALSIHDVEPANSSITIRQLMNHTSGLTYGMFDPGSELFNAYRSAKILHPGRTLGEMITALAPLPLAFHPGTKWEYSVATDVIARLIEVISGDTFARFLSKRLFKPLGMDDTDFWVPDDKLHRLCTLYSQGVSSGSIKSNLIKARDKPFVDAYLRRMPRESGGGGLVSTMNDSIKFIRVLLPGGPRLFTQQTLDLIFDNQLPTGMTIPEASPCRSEIRGHGLCSAVTIGTTSGESSSLTGEIGWGGLAGTSWWINPRFDIAGVFLTQRDMYYDDPTLFEMKLRSYEALGVSMGLRHK